MSLTLIAAMADNRVIGRANALPWRLPEDLRRFRRLTMGHRVVIGRRTWESIGRPLPGRRVVVVSRQPGWQAEGEGVSTARSLEEALAPPSGEAVFVAGGEQIYRQTLPLAGRIELTRIFGVVEGDAWFPAFESEGWRLVHEERPELPDSGELAFRFQTWERSAP